MTRLSAILFGVWLALAVALVRADEDPAAAFLVAATTVSATDSSGGNDAGSCTGCGDCSCDDCGPGWVFRGGALILQRSTPISTTLITGPDGATLVDASSLHLGWEPGFEVVARRSVNECRSIEARYFQIHSGDAVSTVSTPSSVVAFQGILTSLALNFPNYDATATYSALLRNVELNVSQQVRDWWSWSVGLRYVNLEDELVLTQGPFFTHQVRALNNLFGGQVGAESCLLSRGRFGLEAGAKAGLYFDQATSDYRFRYPAIPGFDADLQAVQNQLSFVGEIDLVGTYRLTERITLRGGYRLLWLEGVAVAPDQFGAISPAPPTMAIKTDGGVLYHGAIAAMEIAW